MPQDQTPSSPFDRDGLGVVDRTEAPAARRHDAERARISHRVFQIYDALHREGDRRIVDSNVPVQPAMYRTSVGPRRVRRALRRLEVGAVARVTYKRSVPYTSAKHA